MTDIEMGIDSFIQRIFSVYYAFGIWHSGIETKLRKYLRVFAFLFCTISYPAALVGGGLVSPNFGDAIFLLTLGVVVVNWQMDQHNSISNKTDHYLFEKQLVKCIQMHQELERNVNCMGSFFSPLFFIQIGTSAFCICGSVYILAVDSSSKEGLFFVCIGLLYYATLDIFFLMYLGNEIKISSSKLAYSLYESNWMEQTSRCKGIVMVLAEVLKRHQLIMVAKLYSLSLETFNAIMRGAYSMFNLLNSM